MRKQKFYTSYEKYGVELCKIAVPGFNQTCRPFGAFSMAVPSSHFSLVAKSEILEEVQDIATSASIALGAELSDKLA